MSEIFEYYVKYSEELRIAGKWVIAYAKLYTQYISEPITNYEKLAWVKKRGKIAVNRLEDVLS